MVQTSLHFVGGADKGYPEGHNVENACFVVSEWNPLGLSDNKQTVASLDEPFGCPKAKSPDRRPLLLAATNQNQHFTQSMKIKVF